MKIIQKLDMINSISKNKINLNIILDLKQEYEFINKNTTLEDIRLIFVNYSNKGNNVWN